MHGQKKGLMPVEELWTVKEEKALETIKNIVT
jgi:hypothetical protein